MNNLIKYFLNFFDPETAHKLAVSMLSRNHFISYRTKNLYTRIANLEFKNPIGLAQVLINQVNVFMVYLNWDFHLLKWGLLLHFLKWVIIGQ